MKNKLINYLESHLKGETFFMSNGESTHHIYPCGGCGGVMYALYTEDNDTPNLNIELEDKESIGIACKVWNSVSGLNPMSKQNFLQFLVYLNNVAKAHEEQLKK